MKELTKAESEFVTQLMQIAGRLAAFVDWSVKNPGECLGDHPKHLEYARQALADARALTGQKLR